MLLPLSVLFTAALLWLLFASRSYDSTRSFEVRVLQHSISEHGVSAISFYLMYPRFIHAEMMTHKDFSRSAASSRAIPVLKVLAQVWNRPAMPVHWGVNIPGMQAKSELKGWKRRMAINAWMLAGKLVCIVAYLLTKLNLHKQVANRMLEPWQLMHVTLTTSKLANFFNLRIHPDAQPEICLLATMMRTKLNAIPPKLLKLNEWHLPWVDFTDLPEIRKASRKYKMPVTEILVRVSAARCARSSYATFDGVRSIDKDLSLYDKLITTKPVHASPAEHQVTPDFQLNEYYHYDHNKAVRRRTVWRLPELHGNMIGWVQHRKQIPQHYFEG